MKIVLDTNVFISGIFYNGPPFEILKAWRHGKLQIVISPEILDEYIRVADILSKKFTSVNIRKIIDLVTTNSELKASPAIPIQVCKDPDDDKFLACALSSKTKLIVSGDKHLLNLNGYKNLKILKPKEFVDKYLK